MKIFDYLKYLCHDFENAYSSKHHDDFICKNCKIRVYIKDDRLIYIYNYIDDNLSGEISWEFVNLTCNEQIIKNILE